jgi:hypothetical protein
VLAGHRQSDFSTLKRSRFNFPEADFWPGRIPFSSINQHGATAPIFSLDARFVFVLVFVAGSMSASQAGENILHP